MESSSQGSLQSDWATGVSSLKSPEKICNPAGHRIFMATNHTIRTEHQHGLTCKRKDHPICPRLGEPNDIATNQTRENKLPHQQSGKQSVLSLFSHKVRSGKPGRRRRLTRPRPPKNRA